MSGRALLTLLTRPDDGTDKPQYRFSMGLARHCRYCTEWLGFGEDVCPRCGSEPIHDFGDSATSGAEIMHRYPA
jgi:hypothetical protein